MLETLGYSDFERACDSRFLLSRGEVAFEALLSEVRRHPNSETGPGHECYSLFFRLPGGSHPGQGIHHLEHPELGSLDLFLVPVSPDCCEAVINRLPTSGG